MDPLTLATLIGAGSSLIQGISGVIGANSAANAQTDAANKAIKIQQDAIKQARADAAPWLNAGKAALKQYQVELGLAKGTSKFTTTPGYDFTVSEGEKAAVNNLAALGMKNSGAALKRLTDYRTGVANQYRENYLTRLNGLATGGSDVTTTNNANALNGATNIGSLTTDAGASRASGFAAATNALNGAVSGLSDTVNNYLGRKSTTGWSFA